MKSFTERHPIASATRVALLAATLAAGAAQALTINGVGSSGTPGGDATVRFDFGFGADTSLDSLAVELLWNPAELAPIGASASYQGAPIDPEAALTAAGWFTDAVAPGSYNVTWYALDPVTLASLPPLQLSGLGSLSITFGLAPSLKPGQTSAVSISLEGGLGDLEIMAGARALVTVVPEPASWALMLAGLAGVATLGAQAARRRRDGASGA